MPTPSQNAIAPAWGRWWLRSAGIYNLVFGAAVILAPGALFRWAGMEPMRYPEIWQCVGMIVGVYGIGYLIAARDHRTHWPIVLVGLLGKILGPIGFLMALGRGALPVEFALIIVTNDIIWWAPFAMILWDAARSRGELPAGPQPTLDDALDALADQRGTTLRAIADAHPTLIVLTRHSGCTFCREMLSDLSRQREAIAARGYHIAVITMSPPEDNVAVSRRYGLDTASWFSDPDRIAYRALELPRGTFRQLFSPTVFLRGFAAAARGHGIGPLAGDGFQMPGAFVVFRGRVIREFRHRLASDRPDLATLACEIPR